jgi:hypothetical protein
VRVAGLVALSLLFSACKERGGDKTSRAMPDSSLVSSATNAGDAHTNDENVDTADATVADATPETLEPALFSTDGAALPQTDARPSLESTAYRTRIELIWRAIVRDDPSLAAEAFFPLVAYQQVKAIPKPAADWNARLMKAFSRDIHAYHKKLGEDSERARFLRLDVPLDKVKWMEPGTEGNKLGYYRVLRATLRYVNGAGKEGSLDVTSMISWRGEWFVVHLAGFK